MEITPFWLSDLKNLPHIFSEKIRTPAERNSIEALEHLYGYMTFNNNKYGVLSNWTRAWFLRRVEKDGGGKTLECASVELDGSANSLSMLKALVGMVLLAEKDWLYAFSTLLSHPHLASLGTRGLHKMLKRRLLRLPKITVLLRRMERTLA